MNPMNERAWSQGRWDYLEETHKDPRYLWDKTDYGWNDACSSVSFCAIARSLGVKTILDYGCGKGNALNNLIPEVEITNYDPWIEQYSKFPTGTFDLVVSYAVLNQVDPWYMDDVLNNMWNFTKGPVLISLAKRIDMQQEPYYTNHIERHFNILTRFESPQKPSALDGVPFTALFYQLDKKKTR